MSVGKKILKQINKINQLLIDSSIQVDFNNSSDTSNIVTWGGQENIAFLLKDLSYRDSYDYLLKQRQFNFKLFDGALIQMMYKYKRNEILEHRLAYYPNPNAEIYQENIEEFEENYYGNKLFADIYEKNSIIVPIRFDFDIQERKYIEHHHTYSHLTLGNYKSCRIPVSRAISPMKFILFILRSFYFEKFEEFYALENFSCDLSILPLISVEESKYLHINL